MNGADTPLARRQADVRNGIDRCKGPEVTSWTVTAEALARSFERARNPADNHSYGWDHIPLQVRYENQQAQRDGWSSREEQLRADPDYRQCQAEYEQDGRELQQANDRGEEYHPSWADDNQHGEADGS